MNEEELWASLMRDQAIVELTRQTIIESTPSFRIVMGPNGPKYVLTVSIPDESSRMIFASTIGWYASLKETNPSNGMTRTVNKLFGNRSFRPDICNETMSFLEEKDELKRMLSATSQLGEGIEMMLTGYGTQPRPPNLSQVYLAVPYNLVGQQDPDLLSQLTDQLTMQIQKVNHDTGDVAFHSQYVAVPVEIATTWMSDPASHAPQAVPAESSRSEQLPEVVQAGASTTALPGYDDDPYNLEVLGRQLPGVSWHYEVIFGSDQSNRDPSRLPHAGVGSQSQRDEIAGSSGAQRTIQHGRDWPTVCRAGPEGLGFPANDESTVHDERPGTATRVTTFESLDASTEGGGVVSRHKRSKLASFVTGKFATAQRRLGMGSGGQIKR